MISLILNVFEIYLKNSMPHLSDFDFLVIFPYNEIHCLNGFKKSDIKNMNRTVFIEYETKTREFDGRLLLINYLLNSGVKQIFFGSKASVMREAMHQFNGIYIFKSVTKNIEKIYKKLKKRGFSLVLLHVEGGIHYKDDKSVIISYFTKEMMCYFDYIFVFGQNAKDGILRYVDKNLEKKVIVSGEPRFDLLKERYREFFKAEINQVQAKYKEFILINTSFSVANPQVGKEKLIDFIVNKSAYSDETKELLLYKMSFLKNVLQKYLEAIKILSEKFPDINFVIRPHPSESKKTYEKYFKKHHNIVINREGNVVYWILASKAVIHYDCTTGMEAVLAKRPVVSFLPEADEKILAWLPVELSFKAENINNLINIVRDIKNNEFIFKLSEDVLKQWEEIIFNVDENSSQIICDHILRLNKSFKIENSSESIKKIELSIKRVKRYLVWFINKYLKKGNIGISKTGKISKREIQKKITTLSKLNKFNFKIRLSYKGHDVVLIERK